MESLKKLFERCGYSRKQMYEMGEKAFKLKNDMSESSEKNVIIINLREENYELKEDNKLLKEENEKLLKHNLIHEHDDALRKKICKSNCCNKKMKKLEKRILHIETYGRFYYGNKYNLGIAKNFVSEEEEVRQS